MWKGSINLHICEHQTNCAVLQLQEGTFMASDERGARASTPVEGVAQLIGDTVSKAMLRLMAITARTVRCMPVAMYTL